MDTGEQGQECPGRVRPGQGGGTRASGSALLLGRRWDWGHWAGWPRRSVCPEAGPCTLTPGLLRSRLHHDRHLHAPIGPVLTQFAIPSFCPPCSRCAACAPGHPSRANWRRGSARCWRATCAARIASRAPTRSSSCGCSCPVRALPMLRKPPTPPTACASASQPEELGRCESPRPPRTWVLPLRTWGPHSSRPGKSHRPALFR